MPYTHQANNDICLLIQAITCRLNINNFVGLFSPQLFILKILQLTGKFKQSCNEHPYNLHLDSSIVNVLYIYVFF